MSAPLPSSPELEAFYEVDATQKNNGHARIVETMMVGQIRVAQHLASRRATLEEMFGLLAECNAEPRHLERWELFRSKLLALAEVR